MLHATGNQTAPRDYAQAVAGAPRDEAEVVVFDVIPLRPVAFSLVKSLLLPESLATDCF